MAHAAQEFKQPTFIKARSYSVRKNDHSSGFKALRNKIFNAFVQTGSWLGFGPRADVYDLVNCGPRNQFVVFGDDGPLIVHNCTQALCRDMLAFALVGVERAGWPIVLHVHDEIVTDVPNEPQYSAAELERLMCELPDWAEGFPLAAEGQELMRYAK